MKAFWRLLFKYTSVDGKSTETPKNVMQAPSIITLIRKTRANLKIWDHLQVVQDDFPQIRIAQMETPT